MGYKTFTIILLSLVLFAGGCKERDTIHFNIHEATEHAGACKIVIAFEGEFFISRVDPAPLCSYNQIWDNYHETGNWEIPGDWYEIFVDGVKKEVEIKLAENTTGKERVLNIHVMTFRYSDLLKIVQKGEYRP